MPEESLKLHSYPLVSIITVNYNHTDTTIELIESLNHATYPNVEVIVVDNNSVTRDQFKILEKHPSIRLVESPVNYGFAAGSNYGIMLARGKYIFLLNNDCIVTPGFLEPLVEFMEEHPESGAVSPKIKYCDHPDIIQFAGFTAIHPITSRNYCIGHQEKDLGQYDQIRETAFTHGAAMMVPMNVILKAGMMSYAYFLYYEEADWCERIRRAGYKMHVIPQSCIYHKESMSTGKYSTLKLYYLSRNRIMYIRRNFVGMNFIVAMLYQLFVAIPKNTFIHIISGKPKSVITYFKGIGWHLLNISNTEIHENPSL
ncbi:MAG: glycosyltransferase family 2 protein [Bacteroidales bacterium]|nr:glycosyltransferase family 2 protein [Bacteroidales bacterium]